MNYLSPERETANRIPVDPILPNGPGAAAILSAGIGCFLLSVFAVAADASKPVAKLFTFYVPTGPLSGVSTSAILLWLIIWVALARLWRHRTVAIKNISVATFVFLFLGVLLTFPPFADLLLGK